MEIAILKVLRMTGLGIEPRTIGVKSKCSYLTAVMTLISDLSQNISKTVTIVVIEKSFSGILIFCPKGNKSVRLL